MVKEISMKFNEWDVRKIIGEKYSIDPDELHVVFTKIPEKTNLVESFYIYYDKVIDTDAE